MTNSEELKKIINQELQSASDIHEVDVLWRKYLGRKGSINAEVKNLKSLSEKDKKDHGRKLNELKSSLEKMFQGRMKELSSTVSEASMKNEWLDVTRPISLPASGSLHPLTHVLYEVEDIFTSMGFGTLRGPQIETEWYNFDSLNIPSNHPARDLWDTFWLKQPKSAKDRLLLRTHTSPMQMRYMQKNKPPFRVIVPGRTFRYEATDASHHFQFNQIEGLMVDESISVANFKAVIDEFFKRFFGEKITSRLRPSYFPFVEPGFEVDISCVNCSGKGCSLCSKTGWLEMMGAGMVHPKVFKHAGYNPKYYTGFAFGVGLDRLALVKYKIDDIRLFYSSDLRFLKQFK